jgi:hypothetical protein
MPNFNRANISETPVCLEINRLIEEAAARTPEENNRRYLGASAIGSECLRRVQFDWMCDAEHSLRIQDIFRRGHVFEALSKKHLIAAGFQFATERDKTHEFTAVSGLLRGHCDGVIVAGPVLPDVGYPCLWEHKCLGAKGWRAIERDGLVKAYPQYAAQIWLYQAYLDLTEHPCLYTVVNADSCERLFFPVLFDAARAQEWSDRAVMIIEATRAGELLARVTDNPEDWRCKMCGHRERCWERNYA